jgi:hypothetical protein
MANASAVAVLANIFTSPGEAFAALKERPSPWLPLLILIAAYCTMIFVYLNSVDLPWFFDRALQMSAAQMTDEQRAQAVEMQSNISPMVLASISAVSAVIAFLAIFALVSFYYTGVGFAMSSGIKFKQWFALTAWCSLPVVLGLLASLANVLVSDARFLPQEALNPLSFGNLLALDTEGASMLQRIAMSLDLTTLWSVVLQVLGFQAWTGRSTAVAAAVVLGPVAVIVLLSALATL